MTIFDCSELELFRQYLFLDKGFFSTQIEYI